MIKRLLVGIITTVISTASFGITPNTFGGWFQSNDVVVTSPGKQYPYSLKMTSNQKTSQLGTVAEIKPSLNTSGKVFQISVKSSDWTNTERFVVIFGSDSYSLQNTITLDVKSQLINPPNSQWIEIVVPFSALSVFGKPDTSNINIMIWQTQATAGSSVETEVRGMNTTNNPSVSGVVSIAFDDGKQATVVGNNIMKKYGFAGTAFIDQKVLGQDNFMNQQDVDQLSNDGWDIAGHAYLYDLYQKPASDIEQIMSATSQYLQSHSYKGANLYSYPNGRITENILLSVQTNFDFGFNINGWNNVTSYVSPYNINRRSIDKYTTVDQIKQWIDIAKERKEWLIITFHTLDVNSITDENYSPAQFEEVCEYLKKSGIDVKPISDIVNKNLTSGLGDALAAISFFEPKSPHTTQVTLTGGYDFIKDSDSSDQHEFYVSVGANWDGFKAGVAKGNRTFTQGSESRTFSTTRLTAEKQITNELMGQLMVGVLEGSNWSPVTANGSLVYVPSVDWRAEAYVARDIVDSIATLDEKITVNSYGVSLDKQINKQVLITGSITSQKFSDNIDRTSYAARLIYTLPNEYKKFSVQLKHQQAFSNVNDNTTPSYFIVEKESRTLLTVNYATEFSGGWSLFTYVGGGYHKVLDDNKPAIEYGVKLTKDVGDASTVGIKYQCTNDFGDYAYQYCWGGVSVSVSF